MNTGQTILAILAVVLLGTNIVSVNNSALQHGVILQQTEIGIFAVSFATSLLEEAQGKAYDKASVMDQLTSLTQLTPPDSLGPDPGEVHGDPLGDFNDFDDFNGLRDTTVVPDEDTFYRWASVVYVDTTSPDITRITRTWTKKMTVWVKGKSQNDTISMSYLFTYWPFR